MAPPLVGLAEVDGRVGGSAFGDGGVEGTGFNPHLLALLLLRRLRWIWVRRRGQGGGGREGRGGREQHAFRRLVVLIRVVVVVLLLCMLCVRHLRLLWLRAAASGRRRQRQALRGGRPPRPVACQGRRAVELLHVRQGGRVVEEEAILWRGQHQAAAPLAAHRHAVDGGRTPPGQAVQRNACVVCLVHPRQCLSVWPGRER